MKNLCVLIRVYDRVEDLEYNIDIIRNTWVSNNYYILVVSNGVCNGHYITKKIYERSDKVVELEDNAGHLKGNSQLLIEGLKYIPEFCDYTILLEADTWLYSDTLITKYVSKLSVQAKWASARWYDRFESNALDFAIVETNFIKSHKAIFAFETFPECWVSNYLYNQNVDTIYIKELMPVLIPSYIKNLFYAPEGRFFVFHRAKMVTHHVELLKKKFDEKKFYFNVVTKTNYFTSSIGINKKIELFKIRLVVLFSYLLIRRSWYSKRQRFIFE